MHIHFLRHATFVVTFNNQQILVDPMFSEAGAMDPIANAGNTLRIPLVPLPLTRDELLALLQRIDAVLVTHTHRDHWDPRAIELLPRTLPILCQPPDQAIIKQAGFPQVIPIQEALEWRGIHITRMGGQHGTGAIGQKMGPVSGYVLQAKQEPSLYIAGDTIWCAEILQALQTFSPERIVLYTGAATFIGSDPITMTADDVVQVCRTVPAAQVLAVHLETVNHCRLTRAALRLCVDAQGLAQQVLIPDDGATIASA